MSRSPIGASPAIANLHRLEELPLPAVEGGDIASQSQPVTAQTSLATSGAEPSAAFTPGPYSAQFGAVHHEDAPGFLFTVEPAKFAPDVASALNAALWLTGLQAALARVDAANASCPVRSAGTNPERCPRCRATDRQHCGQNIGALDNLELVVRAAVAKALGQAAADTSERTDRTREDHEKTSPNPTGAGS